MSPRLQSRETACKTDSRFFHEHLERLRHAITAKDVAEILAISPITVYKLAKEGKLPSLRIGGAVRFDPRAVAQWLRRNSIEVN
jgi:excisionase family DNA binding protein